MTASIHLGYTVADPAKGYAGGEAVEIPLRHTAVTGQTQESGKTTTLEGLIARSGLQAIAYVTKRGESSFHVMQPIAPYFQERADWKFVLSLLEASTETKLRFEQSWIMRASEGARTLQDVQNNIQRFLHGVRDTRPMKTRKGAEAKERWLQKPARGLSGDVYFVLNKYLEDIMPQLGEMPYTTKLELSDGLNVMDLRDYEFPLQALVIRSVTDFIREQLENTINIIPEAWKFAPKQRGSPVRLAAEEYVREAAAMKNFLWIDSQDLAGVADVLMRQVGVWLFGVQRAKHEIERALDHMPEGLPARHPRPADIATLNKGQFYVCFGRDMHKVYVQPAWMTAAHAEAIARGEEEVESAREILQKYDRETRRPAAVAAAKKAMEEDTVWKERYDELKADYDRIKKDLDELRAKLDGGSAAVAGSSQGAMRGHASPASSSEDKAAVQVLSNGNLENIYAYVKQRAAKDGALLSLLTSLPEIEVKSQRNVIRIDDQSLNGALAKLISKGFFKEPKTTTEAFRELTRIGHLKPNANKAAATVSREIQRLAEMGFLTFNGSEGYQSVPGMKVNIVEA